jgi:hypothetical protein
MMTELEAYLASRAGPAAAAWVPLIECACRLALVPVHLRRIAR